MMFRLLLGTMILPCFALLGVCTTANALSWTTYVNPRFGTIAEYPSDIFSEKERPPDNGDGQGFRTPDGRARLSIFGGWNVERDTPQSYLAKYLHSIIEYSTYVRTTGRFFAISGIDRGEVKYERCNFPERLNGIMDCFSISYPAAEKALWDGIVNHISRSLRAGYGGEPR